MVLGCRCRQIISDLKTELNELRKEVFILNGIIKELNKEEDKKKIKELRAMLKKALETSTEKQPGLFDEFESTAENGALEETPEDQPIEVNGYVRKKARTGVSLPADTPVVDVYDNSTIDTCPRCGSPMKEAGEKVYETFTKVNYTVIIRKHVKQFTCTKCIPDEGEGRTVETPETGNMLDGTVCDPTLLAQIIENKFSYAQPLYRQALAYQNIGLSRFTMSAWLMKIGKRLVDNLVPCLEKLIYSYPLVNTDETPVKVLGLLDKEGNKKAPNSRANAWMIVRVANDSKGWHGPVMFTFSENKRADTITKLLKSYTGVIQTDGLYSYDSAEKKCSFTHIDCWVHARRKSVEASYDSKEGTAFEMLKLYASFFHAEGLLKDDYDAGKFSDEDYLTKRREKLLPILNKLKALCEENVNNSAGKIHTAVNYPLERWDSLIRFLDYPFATSSNQRAENAIRPFCVGRRNWLFNITEFGAEASALYYSLVESCKSMNINFQDYMTYVLLHANTIKDGDVDAWTNMLPGRCDISSIKSYREKLLTAKPDPERTEPYKLRGKRV